MGEELQKQELISYGIIEGYERALEHQKEATVSIIAQIVTGKVRLPHEILDCFTAQLHKSAEYLLEMKEFLLEIEEQEEPTELESAVVALVGAISQILH